MNDPLKIEVPLPKGFDPRKHGAQLVAYVEKKYGPGYELTSINMEKGVAYAYRQASMNEVHEEGNAIQVKLTAALRKPSAGEQAAAKFEEQYPGYYLVKFEPYLGRAVLAKMTDDEVRCRGALAEVVGVKPWDVAVQKRRGGGFQFKLPKYTPSKHDDKLDEVATSVVGKFGWYVDVDPNTLTGAIVPSEPPTFPAVVPFPFESVQPITRFDKAGDKEWFTFELAEELGAPGQTNRPLTMSMDDSTAVLIVGLPGSGKALTEDTVLPTPNGWARNDELEVGDLIYAADGTTTKATGFSPWTEEPTYTVHFADGQSVDVSATHLWRVRNSARPDTHIDRRNASALRARAEGFVGSGAVATLEDIAQIAECEHDALHSIRGRIQPLGVTGYIRDERTQAWSYAMDDLYWSDDYCGYRLTDDDIASLKGRWMTAPEFVTHLVNVCGAPESCADPAELSRRAHDIGARKQLTTGWRKVDLYPVDEVVHMLADDLEGESIVTTQDMMTAMLEHRARWKVRVPEAIECPEADLPIDPWLFGVWLGGDLAHYDVDHDWLAPRIEAVWPEVFWHHDDSGVWRGRCVGMQAQLRALGASRDKHIPALYARSSVEQRFALLHGLMEARGSMESDGLCTLTLDGEQLIADTLNLIRSLGIKASSGVQRIVFATTPAMQRKEKWLPRRDHDGDHWNEIVDITVGAPARMRCIKVDHPKHLFLVEGFVPTHNSVSIQSMVYQAIVKGYRLAVINTPAKKTDYSWAKPYVHDHWWGCDDQGTSCAEALTVATLVDEEGKRMGALLEQYSVGKWQDLPEGVKKANPPVFVVADELANLLNKPNIPSGLTKEAKALPQFVQMAQDYLEAKLLTVKLNALVAVHRAAGLREAYLTQRPSKTEGFPPELKSLIPHRMLLGPTPSDSDVAMAFRDAKRVVRVPGNIASDAIASRGAGMVHLDGEDPAVIKGFFAPNATFEEMLRKHMGPGDPSDARVRPTAEQIARCVPRVDGDSLDDDDDDDSGPKAPSGRSAREVAEAMGDTQALANMDFGLKGYEKANAMRNQAAGGGVTRKQREEAKEEARNAARSGEVTTSRMTKCNDCGGWVNPVTHKCMSCGGAG